MAPLSGISPEARSGGDNAPGEIICRDMVELCHFNWAIASPASSKNSILRDAQPASRYIEPSSSIAQALSELQLSIISSPSIHNLALSSLVA